MLDSDLAQLHGVQTKRLNEQVRRMGFHAGRQRITENRYVVPTVLRVRRTEVNVLFFQGAVGIKSEPGGEPDGLRSRCVP